MSVEKVRQVHNAKSNPQNRYHPSEEFDVIFRKIWDELHNENEELFPNESVIKDSAIYKEWINIGKVK